MRYSRAKRVVDRTFGGNITVKLSAEQYALFESVADRMNESKTAIAKKLLLKFLEEEKANVA